jgi:hypothetical protein
LDQPFLVKKSDKPLVKPEVVNLYTDLRAVERQKFEQDLQDRLVEEELMKENQKKLQMASVFFIIIFLKRIIIKKI